MKESQKDYLLNLAKSSIETYLKTGKPPVADSSGLDEFLTEKRGAFVTLHLNGNLRGCIGYILPYKPLYLTVIENAINAAFRDPRFPELSAGEFRKIDIEISVLSIPRLINSISEITLGTHGIILKNGFYQAVFLPQVAPEQGWDLETTLQHLSLKASGDMDLWRDPGTKFEVFEAEIIRLDSAQ